jgi:hypothetical protein
MNLRQRKTKRLRNLSFFHTIFAIHRDDVNRNVFEISHIKTALLQATESDSTQFDTCDRQPQEEDCVLAQVSRRGHNNPSRTTGFRIECSREDGLRH